jgi:hypothetical protein
MQTHDAYCSMKMKNGRDEHYARPPAPMQLRDAGLRE